MHDLLEEMGKNIEKSNKAIGKQSRLWSPGDIDEMLKKNRGNEFVQSVVLKDHNYDGRWDPNAFSNMHNLRILIISHGLPLPFDLKCLPDSLKVVEWNEFPSKFLPTRLELNKLVDLKMHRSKIKQLWIGIQNFGNLKFIDLSDSKDLIRTPNFFGAPNLESLVLEGCSNLAQVHESVAQLKKLVTLNLKDCINIKYLPRKLETKSLKDFILCGCSKLKKLPEFDEDMGGISTLDLRGCKNLDCLPNSIWNSKHFKDLDISGCSKLIKLPQPEIMNASKSLERLDMSETAIQEVPPFINRFQNLESLSVRGGRGPTSNPWRKLRGNSGLTKFKLPPLLSLPMLREFNASYCNIKDGSITDDLSCLSSLEILNLSGNNFVTLPRISKLHRLRRLELDDCPKLQTLPVFPPSLSHVCAVNAGPMEPLSDSKIRLLWKMFDMVDQETYAFDILGMILTMPGNQIPAWFHTQENVSIKIEVPHCCRSSGKWEIVVCLLVEPATSVYSKRKTPEWWCGVDFNIRAPEDGPVACSFLSRFYSKHSCWGLNRPHLLIRSLHPSSHKMIQKAIRDGHNRVGIHFSCMGHVANQIKISRCGWRVICNHDVQQNASINDFDILPSPS